MTNRIAVNPDIILWSINRAGLNLPEFLAKNSSIQLWLEGKRQPTVKQLQDFSKKVFLPFGYFFLPAPPEEKLPIPYYRTGGSSSESIHINVYDTILILQQRQEWLKNYLNENGFDPLPFVGKYKLGQDIKTIASDIRSALGLKENWASDFSIWQETLVHLDQCIENIGIITVINGVVENNTHRPVPVDECRGFVLTDNFAPFMFINNADWKSAQIFTMAHELAHIWTGHSAGFDFRKLQPSDDPVEIFCDKIAAEFLVPEDAFNNIWNESTGITGCARHFKVSEIVIARRALDTGKMTKKEFFAFWDDYSQKEFIKKEKQGSGGNFYNTSNKRISLTFAGHVNHALKSGQLLYRDACHLTGLYGDTFASFMSGLK
ncbi:MAG: ImmA/IrrE family metallo-endopeptidase [Ignavibacteriaceae bacterium]|nr:ImmA/IrrE family metallo-endopeptidase [Ignavibacteriaceae bacterium]